MNGSGRTEWRDGWPPVIAGAAGLLLSEALLGVAAAALLLLFVGVYNSWDAISYHALSSKSDAKP